MRSREELGEIERGMGNNTEGEQRKWERDEIRRGVGRER